MAIWVVLASLLGGCTGANDAVDRLLGREPASDVAGPSAADVAVGESSPAQPSPDQPTPDRPSADVVLPVDLDAVVGEVVEVGASLRATPGSGGGQISFATSTSADVRLNVPPGAVADEVELTVGEVELPDYRGARIAAGSPALFTTVANDAMVAVADQQPPFRPMQVLAAAIDGLAPVGPMLQLGPAGTTFDTPLEVVLPFDTEEVASGVRPMPVLISADGTVEVLEPGAIDQQAGTVTVTIDHLSILGVVGGTVAALGAVGAAATLYLGGPRIMRNGPAFAAYAIGAGPIAEAASRVPTRESLHAAFVREVLCGDVPARAEAPLLPGSQPELPSPGNLLEWLAWSNPGDEPQFRDAAAVDALQAIIEANGQRVANAQGSAPQPGARPPRPLGPEEVFQAALALSDGDVFRALLTSHNVLKEWSVGRDEPSAVPFRAGLEQLRQDRDDPGAWYHMFGTATFTYLTRASLQRSVADPQWGLDVAGWQAEQAALLAGGLAATVEEMFFADLSGDMTGDPTEYVFDLRGTQLGVDLFATFHGRDHDELRAEYGIDDDACDDAEELRIARLDGPAVVAVGTAGAWVVEFGGGVAPYEVQASWSDGREPAAGSTQAAAEIARTFTQPGDYVLTVTATDADGTQIAGEAAFEVQEADDILVLDPPPTDSTPTDPCDGIDDSLCLLGELAP